MTDEIRPRRRAKYTPSPAWREQVVYFLLPDRFEDGRSRERPLLDRGAVDRVAPPDGPVTQWYWNHWAISGRNRFQGGTIAGIADRLDYLQNLGVTTVWLAPVFRQRASGVDANVNGDVSDDPYYPPKQEDLRGPGLARDFDFRRVQTPRDDYHGYAIQNFVEVDPRFGSEDDLCRLVDDAHARGMYVVLDVVINHATECFAYDVGGALNPIRPPYLTNASGEDGRYPFGGWLDARNMPIDAQATLVDPDAGVWPEELQYAELFSRRGLGDYGVGEFDADIAEFRTSDYRNRDFYYPAERPGDGARSRVLDTMVRIYGDWIARTDCDGFRVDTFKHVPEWVGVAFAERIRRHARELGKADFLVMCEIGGSDAQAATYLRFDQLRVLELGARRVALRELAGGDPSQAEAVLKPTVAGLNGRADKDFSATDEKILDGLTDSVLRDRVVTSIDDHDGLGISPLGRLAGRYDQRAVIPATAFLLYGPGLPCLYYGTEQALSGPVGQEALLEAYGWTSDDDVAHRRGGDRYLREAMFGPEHPRPAGRVGRDRLQDRDVLLPGFGPSGTWGRQVFDDGSPWYRAIGAMARLRKRYPVLATGEIETLPTGRVDGGRYGAALPEQVIVWTRTHAERGLSLVVVDLGRGDDGAVAHRLEVELPPGLAGAMLTRRLRLIRGQCPDEEALPGGITAAPQTRVPHLDLGEFVPEEIRVYLADAGQR